MWRCPPLLLLFLLNSHSQSLYSVWEGPIPEPNPNPPLPNHHCVKCAPSWLQQQPLLLFLICPLALQPAVRWSGDGPRHALEQAKWKEEPPPPFRPSSPPPPSEGQNEQWREANRRRQRQTIRYRAFVPDPPPSPSSNAGGSLSRGPGNFFRLTVSGAVYRNFCFSLS